MTWRGLCAFTQMMAGQDVHAAAAVSPDRSRRQILQHKGAARGFQIKLQSNRAAHWRPGAICELQHEPVGGKNVEALLHDCAFNLFWQREEGKARYDGLDMVKTFRRQ